VAAVPPAHHKPRQDTECPSCGNLTETIAGRCPNCGIFKDARRQPLTSPRPRGSFWDDLDEVAQFGLVVAPLTVLAILGAIFFAPEIALVAVLLVLGYTLLSGVIDL
jgi:hypothetical protein